MDPLDDLLQERLARLEAGEPLEVCLAGLPEEEVKLMRKAALLHSIADTAPASEGIAAQRRELLQLVKEKRMSSQSPTANKARPRWLLPAALAGGAFTLVSCIVVLSLLAGLAGLGWFNRSSEVAQNPTPVGRETPAPGSTPDEATPAPAAVAREAPDAQSAVLIDAHGLVEVQASDGTWARAEAGHILKAGQRVRTGALSSVTLAFYDDSQARLGPKSEVSVDELDARKDGGPRVVALTQWVGESDHDVAASSDAASKYEVRTPSGTGTAKGTVFHVFVSITLLVRFDVDEGAVDVTSVNVTQVVAAGQSTVIVSGQPPAEPFFRMMGEGKVERIGVSWRIAGRTFQTNDNTVIIGQPQVGDWVAFEARIMPDGTRFADLIVLLAHAPENRFEFSGTVDAIGESEWTIAGRVVRMDEQTEIDNNLQVGDQVEVKGGIAQDGTLWASRIRLLEDEAGFPFEFTGVVQGIAESAWTISSIPVTLDANTQIETGIAVGDVVRVKGRILDDGTWLAKSIQRAEEDEREFVIVGRVDNLDPWRVGGIEFTTDGETEIDEGIEVGDRVRVEGRILEDGTWLAREIEVLDEAKPRRFHFVGIVSSINPWIVGGIPLTVDENTEIEGDVAVGDLVRVKGVTLGVPDGTWRAEKIKRLERNRGCLNLSTAVRSVDANQIVLLDWQTVKLGEGIHVEGELKIATVIIISGCIRDDGTLIIVNIIVIYQLDVLPIIIIQPPGDGDDDDDDDDE